MAITQGVSGSSGSGGAATLAPGSVSAGAYVLGSILDGAIVTLGALGDGAVGDASGSLNAHTRQIAKLLGAGITLGAGAAVIGAVTQSGTWNVTVNTALPGGANAIGTVGVTSLPALPAGANSIGTVVLGAGAAVIGAVTQSGTWNVTVNTALPAGSNSIGTVVLGAGAAVVGAVTQSGTWNVTVNAALPTGTNTIGAVTGPGAAALATDRTTAAAPFSHQLSDGAAFYVGAKTGQLPAALVNNRLDINVGKVPGTVSTANSTTATLANGAVFTGTSEDVSGYSSIGVNVFADQSSAANGLSLQWSSNGTNWDIVNNFTVALNVGQTVLLPPRAQFFRVVYTNGGVTQTNFRLQTVYHLTQLSQDVGTAAQQVQGTAAVGAAVVGNPVLLGAWDGTNLQYLKMSDTTNNLLKVQVGGGANVATVGNSAADALAAGVNLYTVGFPSSYNGTNWDRLRNNVDVTLLASAARTTAQNSANITTYNCKGIIVTLDLTASGGAISLTPSINYIDPASGKAIPLLTGATIAATGTFSYWVNENALASVAAPFTKTAQADLGRVITINIAVGNANSQTYSVGYTLIP